MYSVYVAVSMGGEQVLQILGCVDDGQPHLKIWSYK